MTHSAELTEIRRRNLQRLLAPASIAVVGASSDPNKAGAQALRALAGFPGQVVAVHPRETSVHGVPCYPSLSSLPHPVDLAVLAIPAEHCVAAAREAAAAGIGGIFIISGGFSETGEEGSRLQEQLQQTCRETGLRLLGPNTSGFINPYAGCTASFVPGVDQLRRGGVAVVAQSGGVNLSISFLVERLGEGISLAVGLGNAVDIDATDILEWLADDPNTKAVALHLEGVPRGRALAEAVKHTAARKPVVALVAGRADVGEFAVSHTGNLMGSHQRTVAALRQAGAVVVNSTEELAQAAAVFRHNRLPANARPGIALVTGQAGPGLLIADGLKSAGLEMPSLSQHTQERIESLLPPLTFIKNPVDTGRPGPGFGEIVQAVAEDPAVDVVLVFGLHEPAVLDPAAVLADVARNTGKAIVFGTLGTASETETVRKQLAEADLAMVESPERLVLAASALVDDARARWRLRTQSGSAGPTSRARQRLEGPFDEDRAKALIAEYGIATPQRRLCTSRSEAVRAFRAIGAPVAVKIVAADVAHKTDAGGVHLNIADEHALDKALDAIERIPTRAEVAFLIEQMAPEGVELIIGGTRDASWGPTVMIGIGGVLAEAFADTAISLAPLTAADIDDMLAGLRGKKLLDGFRHLPACNRGVIIQAAIGIGRLMIEHPEIREIEINPLRVYGTGALALDALVVLDD